MHNFKNNITENEMIKIFNCYFPENKIQLYSGINSSWKSSIWRVVLDNEQKLIVKFLSNKNQINRRFLERNCYLHLKSNKLNVPIPEPIVIDTSLRILNCAFVIEEYLEGDNLFQVIDKVENKAELMRNLAKVIVRLNSVAFDSHGYLNQNFEVEPVITWKDLILNEINQYISIIRDNHFLLEQEVYKLEKKIKKDLLYLFKSNPSPKLVHNDLTDRNIKICESSPGRFYVSGIIDFELALSGDPLRDLSKLEYFFDKNPGYKSLFYKEYCKHFNLSNDYQQRVEFYCILNSLKHLSLQEQLLTFSEWREFLLEDKERIIKYIKRR